MKRIFFLSIVILVGWGSAEAQQITGVDFVQVGKTIEVTYNITNAKKGQEFDVELWYKKDYDSYKKIYINLHGDYGKVEATRDGTIYGKIIWKLLEGGDKQLKGKLSFIIRANIKNTVPAGMVYVKGGTFQMGSNESSDEKPIHSVTVSDFYIGKYEVTNEEYCKFLNAYGSDKVKSGTYSGETMIYLSNEKYDAKYDWGIHKSGSRWTPASGKEKHPVIYVTWFGANEYCKWAGGRLPTEAEWEYAARGGSKSNGYTYSGSNTIGNVAWYDENSYDKGSSHTDYGTHVVGTKKTNELGIYDLSGNVWEWCSDWYGSDYYSSSPSNNPNGASSGSNRALRGGSWYDDATHCRVAYRYYDYSTNSDYYDGFRLARRP